MDLLRLSTAVALLSLASCATSAPPSNMQHTSSYEAQRQADGTIDITLTARSERLALSPSDSFTLDLTDMLEQAATNECEGAFELVQAPLPTTEIKNGRLVATLSGTATCKQPLPAQPQGA